jgi:hypothetical protein
VAAVDITSPQWRFEAQKNGWIAEIAEMDKPNATSEYTNSKTWKEIPHADRS